MSQRSQFQMDFMRVIFWRVWFRYLFRFGLEDGNDESDESESNDTADSMPILQPTPNDFLVLADESPINDAMMFFRCFLQTMAREWINLDKFR